jgi:hypothetical protein
LIHKRTSKKEKNVTPQEIRTIMAYYLAMHREVHIPYLLKIAGFKIKGLRDVLHVDLQSLGHRYAWNEIGYGICVCGGWEYIGDNEEEGYRQHKVHVR